MILPRWPTFNHKKRRQIKVIFWFLLLREEWLFSTIDLKPEKLTPIEEKTNHFISIDEKRREAISVLESVVAGIISPRHPDVVKAKGVLGRKHRKFILSSKRAPDHDALDRVTLSLK